jgi:hypothetical protein
MNNTEINNFKKFTIVFKTYKQDLKFIKNSLLSLIKYLDFQTFMK